MQTTRNILKYTVLSGLFIIPFIAFLVPNSMFFPFITGKGFSFRVIVEVIFGLFVVLAFLDAEYRPKMTWITKSVLAFTLITFIADIFGVNPYKSLWSNYERMEGFVLIAHLAMYYLVAASMFSTRTKWEKLINTSIGASVLMSFYAFLQLNGVFVINQGSDRVDARFGNASYFAIYLVFHIFFCLYLMLDNAKLKWQKWAYGLIVLFEIVILAFTATRGAILGLIGGLVLTGLIILWKEKENKFFRKISYWTIGVLAAIVLLFISIRHTDFAQRSPVLSRFATLSFSEIRTQGRYYVWPMAIKGFLDKPILGWGQEGFNFVFNKYYDPRMYGQEEWFDRTHDVFLDWLIAGGLLGFLAYFSMYVALLYFIWKKDSALKLSEKSLFTGLVAAYLFHNIFVFDNLISYILFFTLLAYIHSITPKNPSQSRYSTKVFGEQTIQYIVLPISLVATFFVVYFVNVPAFLTNRTLIKAISPQGDINKNLAYFKKVYSYNSFGSTEATEQLVEISSQVQSSTAADSIKQEFYNLAKQKLEEKIAQSPHDARYLVFTGSFFNRFMKYDEAINYLQKAIVESPNKQSIYFELGTSYIGKNDLNKMFEVFKKAYDLQPSAPNSKIIYTLGAIYTRNNTVLNQMSKELDPNIIISDDRFVQAYANIGDYQNVISILTARLERDPGNVQNKLNLASAYVTVGQKQKAISLIQEIIDKDPTFKTQGEGYIKQIQSQ
jgi:tetratricopeptide (TPR) repeat protein